MAGLTVQENCIEPWYMYQ